MYNHFLFSANKGWPHFNLFAHSLHDLDQLLHALQMSSAYIGLLHALIVKHLYHRFRTWQNLRPDLLLCNLYLLVDSHCLFGANPLILHIIFRGDSPHIFLLNWFYLHWYSPYGGSPCINDLGVSPLNNLGVCPIDNLGSCPLGYIHGDRPRIDIYYCLCGDFMSIKLQSPIKISRNLRLMVNCVNWYSYGDSPRIILLNRFYLYGDSLHINDLGVYPPCNIYRNGSRINSDTNWNIPHINDLGVSPLGNIHGDSPRIDIYYYLCGDFMSIRLQLSINISRNLRFMANCVNCHSNGDSANDLGVCHIGYIHGDSPHTDICYCLSGDFMSFRRQLPINISRNLRFMID